MKAPAPIRIALADDQALVRAGLRALLGGLPGLRIDIEAADGQALLDALAQTPVDVIVCDIRMPGVNGIEATQQLRRAGNRIPVLLLTTFDDPALLLAARKAGAQGFLLKDADPDTLLEAILTLKRGGTLLQPLASHTVHSRVSTALSGSENHDLSDRELEVLRLMAGGYANREIAAALHLAEGTVKNYVSDILAKLDCDDRTRAVLKAISLRLI
jgi:DNA-binding NarL/FixJ family response regulator